MNKLRDLLAAKNWKEADTETARLILGIANRIEGGYLWDTDAVPYEDLHAIDRLWTDYSKGHFGFSVQRDIYQGIGVTKEYNQMRWRRFGDTVGWRVNQEWIGCNCIFDLKAPQGHLPVMGTWGNAHDDYNGLEWRGWTAAARHWYSEVTQWHLQDDEDGCHRRFSSFMSRIAKCNIRP
jgi:hypothetical protein